jgi:GNAT superfamily N-acetyltransferase
LAIDIRSFCNTDTDAICEIWNSHHAESVDGQLTPVAFELSVLAKPYFDHRDLQLAIVDGVPKGFVHMAAATNAAQSDVDPARGVLSALCVAPDTQEANIAALLLAKADTWLRERCLTQCFTRPLPPNCPFYLGLGLGDTMMGITSNDQRTYAWLLEAGYEQKIATSFWEVDLGAFQAPVDRLQIQIRRTAHVDRILDEPQMPWHQACMLGHTEPTGFQLTLRAEGRVVQQLLVWSVAPELAVTIDSIVWLWPIQTPADSASTDQITFLLAEALRQMADERVDFVRTVSDSSDTRVTTILTRLGFRNSLSGVVLSKIL